ncbi:cold shock domain-containing protein [Bacteroidota bacterium]
MGRSRETYNKKEVRNKKEKKRKEKEKKRLARKEKDKKGGLDDMIAYVDENGMITSAPPVPGKKKSIELEDINVSTPKSVSTYDINPIRQGKVTFFNESKGYGFLLDYETKERVFVHANNLLEQISEGNVVSYEVEMGRNGPVAVKVKLFKELET